MRGTSLAADATNREALSSGECVNAPASYNAHFSCEKPLSLDTYISHIVNNYLEDIGDTDVCGGLHAMLIREIESPLLREVLHFYDGNQSRAAATLGINRSTLRKKLISLGIR